MYVGTSAGTVEIFESESGCFLQQFSWHASVNVLLELPQEIKQSICGECVKVEHHQSFKDDLNEDISLEAYLYLQRTSGSRVRFDSKCYNSELHSTQQSMPLLDSPVIVSLGNELADCLRITSNQTSSIPSAVEFLIWTGLHSTYQLAN